MKPTLYSLVFIVISSVYVASCVNNEIPNPNFDCSKSDLAVSLYRSASCHSSFRLRGASLSSGCL